MSSGLFGSPPSVSSAPSVTPEQRTIQKIIGDVLTQILGPGTPAVPNIQSGQPAFPSPTGGVYAAPLSSAQTKDINTIQSQTAPGSFASDVNSQAANALKQMLSGQPADYSQYFKTNVAQPLEDVFSTQTLPAIKAAFARSAGGTYSGSDAVGGGAGTTGYQGAVTTATKDLNKQLGQGEQAIVAQAIQDAVKNQAVGVSAAPTIAGLPASQAGTALAAETLPQQVAQTQLSGQTGQFNAMLDSLIRILGGGSSFSTAPTVSQVVNPGQTGLIPGLLGGLAASPGSLSTIGGWFGPAASDPKLKVIKGDKPSSVRAEAIAKLLKLRVAKARYKTDREGDDRVMVMADNVQEYFPKAVVGEEGQRAVKMWELVPPMVAAIQALAKRKAA